MIRSWPVLLTLAVLIQATIVSAAPNNAFHIIMRRTDASAASSSLPWSSIFSTSRRHTRNSLVTSLRDSLRDQEKPRPLRFG
ncbi:unnamed protein product, partial [Mesorhabditis spiculigera]